MRRIIIIGIVLLTGLVLIACAAQPSPPYSGAPGFWWGVLHGFIAPSSLVGTFFDPTIRAYSFPNSGWWYDLGFVLGIGALGGGAGRAV